MKPDPSSSPSGGQNLPARHRPLLEELNQQTTEIDLWSLDDDLDLAEFEQGPASDSAQRGNQSIIPSPRERRGNGPPSLAPAPKTEPSADPVTSEEVRQESTRSRPHSRSGVSNMGGNQQERRFVDSENWADLPVDGLLPPLADEMPDPPSHTAHIVDPPLEIQEETIITDPVSYVVAADESSPVAPEPVVAPQPTARIRSGFSKMEFAGLIFFLVALITGLSAVVFFSLANLPTKREQAEPNDFPIKGESIEVGSAATYWRIPITDGATPDVFRRGTVLLPVIDLDIKEGKGAIRVVFRNENRNVIGDVVTRRIEGGKHTVVSATAGFDEMGMHAAYRTGVSKPWTIEILEGESVDAPASNFKRLFEINISTDRR